MHMAYLQVIRFLMCYRLLLCADINQYIKKNINPIFKMYQIPQKYSKYTQKHIKITGKHITNTLGYNNFNFLDQQYHALYDDF